MFRSVFTPIGKTNSGFRYVRRKGPQFTAFPGMQQAMQTGAPIMTQARSCTVLPAFVGLKLLVHNGKQYVPINVTSEMVGHKLGELVPTKKTWSFR